MYVAPSGYELQAQKKICVKSLLIHNDECVKAFDKNTGDEIACYEYNEENKKLVKTLS